MHVRDGTITIGNAAVSGTWDVRNSAFTTRRITDRINGREFHPAPPAFLLSIGDTEHIAADSMRIASGPRAERLAARPNASRLAEHSAGWQVVLTLRDPDDRVEATWRAVLRDGSRYLRQEVSLSALRAPLPVRSITMVDLALPGAEVVGLVKGSPVVSGGSYAAFEHPLSTSTAAEGKATVHARARTPAAARGAVTVSAVIGAARKGQLRRDFLAYVERERAHPYRTFLHYNSWYDLGYFTKYNEAGALAVIDAVRQRAARAARRHADSFLFDDGWDDAGIAVGTSTPGFPHGFTPLRDAAARYGAAPGVWLSPWGGYGKPKEERLRARPGAGLRDQQGRVRAVGAQVLSALPRHLPATSSASTA